MQTIVDPSAMLRSAAYLMNADTRVVILGAGILGSALAWRLAARGIHPGKQILVIDPQPPAAQASSRAAALLSLARPAAKAHWIPLVRNTLYAIAALADLGHPVPVHRCGAVHLADRDAALAVLDDSQRTANAHDIACVRTLPAQHATTLPWLKMDNFKQALWFPDECYTDPYLLASAYAAAARALGVRFRCCTPARLTLRQETPTVILPDGAIQPSSIWVTAGAWSQRLLHPLGLVAAQAAVRSQYWITEHSPLAGPGMPMVLAPDLRLYARPELGAILFGLREPNGIAVPVSNLPDDLAGFVFDSVDPDGHLTLAHFVERIERYAPGLLQTGLRHYIVGPSCYTPDGEFLVGTFAAQPRVKLLSGCNGAGIAVSAGLADLAADLEAGFDPAAVIRYSPDRFGQLDPDSPEWMARCINARAGKLSG